MPNPLHTEATALLNQVLDLAPAARPAFLERACEGAPALLELVASLLAHMDQLDAFLEAPVVLPQLACEMPVPQPGQTLGHWRVVRELGRGGMGLILLVERSDGAVHQSAALKIVQQRGLDASALARFQRERQILAGLNHADIARLIDAGSTGDGRPYFVMELSEGVPIDQYCADMKLSLQQRIALFARVCHAVHYAHQHLVLHRDLKPANILVAQDGTLKLLDFGIASALGEDTAPDAGRAPLTPQFASPEQLAGAPLSIGSDIYSLGLVLYRLLTGQSPFDADAAGMAPERPAATRPSDAIALAAARQAGAAPALASDMVLQPGRKLARQLRGDLDHILLKALQTDPERRYASADAFARDLQRSLRNEAVHAAPPSWLYRSGKLLRRHPWAFGASGVALAALVIGAGVALWQAREARAAREVAELRFDQTRQLARTMLFDVNDALEKGPTAAREKLLATALLYLRQLAGDGALQPALRRDVASAYERLGDIAGNQVGDNLGRTKDAEAHYLAALKLREAAVQAGQTPLLEDLVGLREVHRRLADIAWGQARVAEARQHYEVAIGAARQAAALTGTPAEALELLSRRRYGAAILYTRGQPNAGQLPAALKQFAELELALQAFMRQYPANADALKVYVPVLSQLVDLQRVTGQLEAARQTAMLSKTLAEKKVAASPDDSRWARQLSVIRRQIGDILIEQGQNAAGLAEIRQALAIRVALAAKDPSNERAARDVAVGHSAIADAMLATGDYGAAEAAFTLARDTFAAQARSNPANAAVRAGLIELELARANTQYLQQHLAAASQTLKALRVQLAAAKADALLDARIDLLEAQLGAGAPAYASAEQALPLLLKESERDPLDTYQQRESAQAWQKVGMIGLRAGQRASGCRYLALAAQRYDALDGARRLNAADQAARIQLRLQRTPCT
ncbi:MAG: serine/threonine-protein kinase [Pseudomonadota bacterium]